MISPSNPVRSIGQHDKSAQPKPSIRALGGANAQQPRWRRKPCSLLQKVIIITMPEFRPSGRI